MSGMTNDTNVGRGMVPHRPKCRCDECRAERTDIELRALRAEVGRLRANCDCIQVGEVLRLREALDGRKL